MSALLIKLTNQEDFNKVMEFIHANKMEAKTDYASSMFYEEEAAYRLEYYLEGVCNEIPKELLDEAIEKLAVEFENDEILDTQKSFDASNSFLDRFFSEKGIEIEEA